MNPELHLTIQYAADCEAQLPRGKVQSWVQHAIDGVAKVYSEADQDLPYQQLELTVRFADTDEVQALNKQYRHKDAPTNVLTFEYGIDENSVISADIIVCCAVLEHEALEQEKPFLHHAAHLTIHGVLHALGYDHIDPDDAEDMEELETEILQLMNIPNPYLTK
ncbi:rRNA maturation RNase YbeY [Paenalcaligenes niemegkensis]|uniref:rRNA maturation RNase YbeY n=1 Tax=Paenalcaligenes niemegkensis TaxID=2895469 RepID=UPI001EE91BA9|nr:rRNA maturation RNase YbeY [Paenalcaligenes niemegkensis]MCQ9617169.1 rRNA maturation RNase YbeY [Paenalcaligenes niemegkensis]